MFKISKIAFAACACAVVAAPAMAADLPPPVPEYQPVPVPPAVISGWYLRGDIGFSNQQVDELDNVLYDDFESVDTVYAEFDAAPIFGVGVGYRLNRWARFDVTGEYRGRADFDGLDIGSFPGGRLPDNYSASKSEWVALANAYVDLGTYRGFSPFVGAGIGVTRTTIHDFTDIGVTVDSVAFADDQTEWDLAWALHAGVGYEVTPNFTVELAYRFLSLGDAESGDLKTFDGVNNIDNPMEFENLYSNDLRVGMRYQFN